MSILTRPKLFPQERFDLEDLNTLLSAGRTDSKLYTKEFLSSLNYIIKGFAVSGIGLLQATINMTDATLIIPQSTTDFSWFTSPPSPTNIIVPAASLTDGVRNYIEIGLFTQDGTPLTRAFWDPEANGGTGSEFNQIVNTVTDLTVQAFSLTGGFSGSQDRLPIAIMDVNGSGVIKSILDRRELFHRLAKPESLTNGYAWGSKLEPAYSLTLSGVSGTFTANEVLTINTETAKCVVGGTSSISFNSPSGINFFPGSTVTGGTSGATGTILTVLESFVGVDKSITNIKQDLDAIKTELRSVKGTTYWWEDATTNLDAINTALNAPVYDELYTVVAPILSGATINLPVNTRLPGSPQQFYIVGKGQLFLFLNGQFLELEASGGYSEIGSSGSASQSITINQNLVVGDELSFRIAGAGPAAGGSGSGAADDNFFTLPSDPTPDNSDFLLIYDVSIPGYRKQLRSVFLTGTGGSSPAPIFVSTNTTLNSANGLVVVNATSGTKTITLANPATCAGQSFDIVKSDSSGNAVIVSGTGLNLPFTLPGQGDLVSVISDGTQYWIK